MMFESNVWVEPDMEIDVVHDGRHKLPDVAMGRESIPYIVVLPEHQIAFFTYTWVSKDSVAGAALAVFGPGVGGDPIQQRRSEEHTSELQSLMRTSYAVFCLKTQHHSNNCRIAHPPTY